MPNTRDDCINLAEAAGFDAYRAGQVCDVAFGESVYGSDTRCACAYTDGGTIYHDAECDARGLTKHCGVFQMDATNPTFAPVIASGCANDLACSLKAMFGITQGGKCFDHPNPWSPHFGFKEYGGCGGQADAALLANRTQGSAGHPCADCRLDPGSWGQCLACALAGGSDIPSAGADAAPAAAKAAQTAAIGLGQFLSDLVNPQTWLNAGIIIAGFVTVMIGINALLSGKVAAGVKDSARAAVLA